MSALAGVLVLGQDGFYFDNVMTVLGPSGYRGAATVLGAGGAYLEGTEALEGEGRSARSDHASWDCAQADALPGYGDNPPTSRAQDRHAVRRSRRGFADAGVTRQARWAHGDDGVRGLVRAVEAPPACLLDPYGYATNEAEFFAVLTGVFRRSAWLRAAHLDPRLAMSELYRLDPPVRGRRQNIRAGSVNDGCASRRSRFRPERPGRLLSS
ncbi:MAG: hypothetical protein U0793_10655 [Gemmataceae bacterium]